MSGTTNNRFTVVFAGLIAVAAAPVVRAQADTLIDPPSIASVSGRLVVTLTAAPASVIIGGQVIATNVYNGLYAPPTLHVRRSDSLELTLQNGVGSGQSTNLHYHGWAVTPQAQGDDVFVHVPVNTSYYYQFQLPWNHSEGMYWYHPHPHGFSESQVLGGMSGALIVDGLLEDNYPELVGIREHVMLLKDIQLPGDSADAPKTKTINGQLNPVITIQPGELQFWRIGNVGADSYVNLSLGGLPFYVIAIDGNVTACIPLNRWGPQVCPVLVTQYLLPPSSRVEIIVSGPGPGAYAINSLAVDTGPDGDPNPQVQLATLVSGGSSMLAAPRMVAARRRLVVPHTTRATNVRPTPAALKYAAITRRDTLVYTEDTLTNQFFINGKQFDPNRNDTYAHVGDVIEFTIINQTRELHTFHIHQTDYLVTEINGQPANSVSLQDNVNLPYVVGAQPGVVKVIVPFYEPVTVGKFVYHCHILEHEDGGMMGTMVLLPAAARRPAAKAAGATRSRH